MVCWAIWIALSALLAVQGYILIAHELPVPPVVLRAMEKHLAEANLAADFSRAQFDPTGKILLENVRLRTRQFEDPILLARSLYARKSVWSVLSGHSNPDEVRLEGGVFQLPAPLSPSGTPEALVSDICATLHVERHVLHIDQLNFRVGPLTVVAHGTFQLPPRQATPPDPARIIGEILQYGRKLARNLDQLDLLEKPTLTLEFEPRTGLGNVVAARLTAASLRPPTATPLTLEQFTASTTLLLDQLSAHPLRVAFSLEHAAVRDELVAERLRGYVQTRLPAGALARPQAAELHLAAESVAGYEAVLGSPILHLAWHDAQPLRATLFTRVHGTAFTLATKAELAARRGELVFDGRVPPDLVAEVLPRRSPRLAPYFVFADPVDVHAVANFTEGWRFDTLRTRVRAERLDSHGVPVTLARGRIDVDHEGNFLAYDALARIGDDYGRGSYFMNFRSWDYRFLLTGELQPASISGWFRSDWWPKFWAANFEFPVRPSADVDVLGNWRDGTKTAYYGSTDATGARVTGADFEQAHAIVFLRPQFVHAFDLRMSRAGGTQHGAGWFKRISDPASHELRRLEYDFAGVLDPETLRHLGHETADTLLKPWKFSRLPEIHFAGATDYQSDGKSVPELKFSGTASGGLTYEGFPLDTLEAAGGVSGTEVRIDQLRLGVAGGHGTAKASINTTPGARRLGFDFYIENADLVRGIRAVHEYEVARGGIDPQSSPNRELLKRASGGKLQFAVSVNGDPDDLKSFAGSGNLQLAGAELGEVHLFGLLSQLLSSLSLNFSSLKLDTLRTSYKVANGTAHFPDVRITGPSALIEGAGDYRLTDRTLDFKAKFRPYEENRNPLTAVIGLVVNPLASILDLRLTGPIQKPNWSVSFLGGGSKPAPAAPEPAKTPANPAPTTAVPPTGK